MQLALITPQALLNSLCNSDPLPNASHHSTRQVPFLADRSSSMHPSLYFTPLLSLPTLRTLKFFPLSLSDLHGRLWWMEPRLFDGRLHGCGRLRPRPIPRAGLPSRRERPWQHKQPKQWQQLHLTGVHWRHWFGKRNEHGVLDDTWNDTTWHQVSAGV